MSKEQVETGHVRLMAAELIDETTLYLAARQVSIVGADDRRSVQGRPVLRVLPTRTIDSGDRIILSGGEDTEGNVHMHPGLRLVTYRPEQDRAEVTDVRPIDQGDARRLRLITRTILGVNSAEPTVVSPREQAVHADVRLGLQAPVDGVVKVCNLSDEPSRLPSDAQRAATSGVMDTEMWHQLNVVGRVGDVLDADQAA